MYLLINKILISKLSQRRQIFVFAIFYVKDDDMQELMLYLPTRVLVPDRPRCLRPAKPDSAGSVARDLE